MMQRRLIAALAAVCLTGAAWAQQFDNFETGPLGDFDLPDPDAQGIIIPGLGDGAVEDGALTLTPLGEQTGILQEGIDGQPVIETFPGVTGPVTSVSQPDVGAATHVTLRALDRMRGVPTDIDMVTGETVLFGRIAISVTDCRFPLDDPSSDAFAHVDVYNMAGEALFSGWMIASSPALNALEHSRYDVWVLSCQTL